MTYATLERRIARNRTGTDPRVGQDNEKYFHIANKVVLPRQGKARQDRPRQNPALCQAMLTLVKNHEHFQVSPSEPPPPASHAFWPHPCLHTHLRAACFCSSSSSRGGAYFNLRRQRTEAGSTYLGSCRKAVARSVTGRGSLQLYRAKAKVVSPLTSCNSLNAPRLPSLGKSLVFCCCCLCACAKSLCKFISSFRPGSCIIVQQAAQLARLPNNLIMPISNTRLLHHYHHHHQRQRQLENII